MQATITTKQSTGNLIIRVSKKTLINAGLSGYVDYINICSDNLPTLTTYTVQSTPELVIIKIPYSELDHDNDDYLIIRILDEDENSTEELLEFSYSTVASDNAGVLYIPAGVDTYKDYI